MELVLLLLSITYNPPKVRCPPKVRWTGRPQMKTSVIIPTYNRPLLVTEAIDSVLAQSTRDFELIVVDDGSQDETNRTLAAYGDAIRLIRQRNGGVNHARNHALSCARGEYIALLDDDDIWHPYKLEIQVELMDRFPELAFCFSNFSIYRDGTSIRSDGIRSWLRTSPNWDSFYDSSVTIKEAGLGPHHPIPESTRVYFGSIYKASLSQYYVLPSTALARRSMIPTNLRFNEQDPICGDWEFFARLSRDHPVAYLDHGTAINRSHEDESRITRTAWRKQLEYRVNMIERLYLRDETFCRQHGDEVKRVYRSRNHALWRQYLLDNDRDAMAQSLRKYRDHASPVNPSYAMFMLANHVPGISHLLRGIRSVCR